MATEDLDRIRQHPSGKVKLAICDVDGILRGKTVSLEKFETIIKGGFGFCDVVFGWDMHDKSYNKDGFTGWHRGFPDAIARIDLESLRFTPWDNDIPIVLADFNSTDNPGMEICPRTLLKKTVDDCRKQGYEPFFSQEFEWFNFRETPESLQEKDFKDPQPLTPGMFGYSLLRSALNRDYFNDLFDQMKLFNVPLEGLHTETGPGVYEAAIAYDKAVSSADKAVFFKTGAREIAYKHGIMASFMAKWNIKLPGCSGHVHQSLWANGKNIFHDQNDSDTMSEIMKHYIAGQLKCLPVILPMLAPTVNSYKRLVPGMWAPTTLTWARDNRTVALRVLSGGEKSCRLETRVVGSDSNPYLAMAACLASGMYGIANKLPLQLPTQGNGYTDVSHGVLPGNLSEATKAMKKSDLVRSLFGDIFVNHFCYTREWEWDQFLNNESSYKTTEVSQWELERYFELI